MKVKLSPLVSEAGGRFQGATLTTWKGLSVLRKFKSPTNPQTIPQQHVRHLFSNLTRLWHIMGPLWRASWIAHAEGKPRMARNEWIAQNVPAINGWWGWTHLLGTPKPDTCSPPTGLVVYPITEGFYCYCDTPDLPPGWSFVEFVGSCLRSLASDEPRTYEELKPTEGSESALPIPYIYLRYLLPTTYYVVLNWFVLTDPAGKLHYSPGIFSFKATL